jgi:bifunctional DNA-binding transcriptional regulator/antitoxin component of YhaV-PrlF toxin-antitoxin module
MTTTTNELGQIVLPAGACAAADAEPGTRFDVLVSTNGEIWLRRRRGPTRTLLEHMGAGD